MRRVRPFLAYIEKSSDKPYIILLSIYFVVFYFDQISFQDAGEHFGNLFQFTAISVVMWGSAIYLFWMIVEWAELWKEPFKLVMIALTIAAVTAVFSSRMTLDSFGWIMGIYFCLIGIGRNYRRELKSLLVVSLLSLIAAYIAYLLGFAQDVTKRNGHSLGIIWKNNWGYILFVSLLLIWYLYLRKKIILTFIVFWGCGLLLTFIIDCRTCAAITIVFPFVAGSMSFIEGRKDRKHTLWIDGIIILLPVLFFIIVMILCWQMEWIRNHLYKTTFRSMAARFVEGGYAIRLNGIHLFGTPLQSADPTIPGYSKNITMMVDSAYVYYLIYRGSIWMSLCLGYLTYIHWKCVKKQRYSLIVISFFMLLLATMERPPLNPWYNFLFLWPMSIETKQSEVSNNICHRRRRSSGNPPPYEQQLMHEQQLINHCLIIKMDS